LGIVAYIHDPAMVNGGRTWPIALPQSLCPGNLFLAVPVGAEEVVRRRRRSAADERVGVLPDDLALVGDFEDAARETPSQIKVFPLGKR
jgi:hypothetical protein